MNFRALLLFIGCLLSAASGQWLEKTVTLPESLSGLHNAGPMLYNPGSNVLFVAGYDGLTVVDGLSHRLVGRTQLVGFDPLEACYAARVNKVYWTDDYYGNTVCSFDGASGRLLARVGISYPSEICYNPLVNRVYVLGGPSQSILSVIDCANDSIVRTLNLGYRWAWSLTCNPLQNKVYFASGNEPAVGVIDCNVDSIRRYIRLDREPRGIVYNRVSGRLYSYAYNETLAVIDCRVDSVIGHPILTRETNLAAYNPVANKLYFAGYRGTDILCGYGDSLLASLDVPEGVEQFVFDSTDNLMWYEAAGDSYRLSAIDGAGDTVCGSVAIGEDANGLCYNPTRNKLYCANGIVTAVDPAAKRVEQRILLDFWPTALCWAKSASKVYCSGHEEAAVAVVSSQSNRVLRLIPVGQSPGALAYDRPLGLVCCANSEDSTVSLITCNGDSVVGTVTVGHGPNSLCVDTVLHKAWCRVENGVAAVDLQAESLSALLPITDPRVLLSDAPRGRVYCAAEYGRRVVVLDAATDSIVASIQVGGEVTAICQIPDLNLICCATTPNNSVAVIDCATNRVVGIVPVGEVPLALLYNPRSRKLYCANSGSDDVTAIDCATMAPVATVSTGTEPTALAYDSLADRVYAVCTYGDAVSVIDCRGDTLVETVAVGDHPGAIAYASMQRRMYIANEYGSSLSVIKDTARVGVEETPNAELRTPNAEPTIVRGVLSLPRFLHSSIPPALIDISGRKVVDLHSGPNDVRSLAPGIYFVRQPSAASGNPSAITKVVLTR